MYHTTGAASWRPMHDGPQAPSEPPVAARVKTRPAVRVVVPEEAAVIVGLLLNPASTSGVATSNRSGAGSWQLYAIDDAGSSDFGIASYSVAMTGQSRTSQS